MPAGPDGLETGREDGIGEFTYFSVEPATEHPLVEASVPSVHEVDAYVAADQALGRNLSVRAQALTFAAGGESRTGFPLRVRVYEGPLQALQAADFAFTLEYRAAGSEGWSSIEINQERAFFTDVTLLPRTGDLVGRYLAAPGGYISDTVAGDVYGRVDALAALRGDFEVRVLAFPIAQLATFNDGRYVAYVDVSRGPDNYGNRAVAAREPHLVFADCRDALREVPLDGRGGTCGPLFDDPTRTRLDDSYEAYCDALVTQCVRNTLYED